MRQDRPGRSMRWAVVLSGLVAGLTIASPTLGGDIELSGPVDYTTQIKPILHERCIACHGALKQEARLRLDTGAAIREGGFSGPAVEPGHADESLLIDMVTEPDPELRMPPEGEGVPLSEEQLALFRAWIDQGAESPADEEPEPDPRDHWAFNPPVRPELPEVQNASWVRNPIDAFLAAEHETRGLEPLPPAEPHVLLRRLYLDLTGLPPTREQLHEFLADPSDEAYQRIVDRLLDSPQYGERWARHWMDVWRYSDWYGRRAVPDVLHSYAMIWRWRDWIVRSLNEDKGYDRMVQEMLAADEIAPDDEETLAATGFIVRNFYRWNYNVWMKESVEHTGKAFLALTFNCAHCHDHKYDPIRHEDYFGLRAFFEPIEIRHDRVPGEPDPGPYPKYEYGKAYGPITSGMVRVFDETLDAETFLYTRGEERNIVPDKPPIPPGMPRFLGGDRLEIEPVDLPPQASYPGLKAFVQREEIEAREAAVAEAEQTLATARELVAAAQRALDEAEARVSTLGQPEDAVEETEPPDRPDLDAAYDALEAARLTLRVDEAQLANAQAQLAALHKRIAADRVKYGLESGHVEDLSRAAARAERQAALEQARVHLYRAERDLTQAKRQARADASAQDAVTTAEQQQTAARQAFEQAKAALDEDTAAYSPLSPSYPERSTGRRTALARWLTDRDNPLAARVAVNHIWRWHFGTPLVPTTADFGRNGKPPTHPELLDWLAVELMEPSAPGVRPWTMKALHRLIVTSSAYRMSSKADDPSHPSAAIDPDNVWYWRFHRSRMEAEAVRDSLLHVAGELDTTLGGPDIDHEHGLTSRRRSLYFTHHGEEKMQFLEMFDGADPFQCYERKTSVIPQQALALTNSDLALALSRNLATRLWETLEPTEDADRNAQFIITAFEQILSRPPSSEEQALCASFLARQVELFDDATLPEPPEDDDRAILPPATDPDARARENLIHALFSHNDFVTIH